MSGLILDFIWFFVQLGTAAVVLGSDPTHATPELFIVEVCLIGKFVLEACFHGFWGVSIAVAAEHGSKPGPHSAHFTLGSS